MSDKKSKAIDAMIEATEKLLDDIFNTCVGISKEWGDENKIALATINESIKIASGNTAKMKGKNIKPFKTSMLIMLEGFKKLCKVKADEMGSTFIPKTVLFEYMIAVKNEIRKGANKPELPPVFKSK